MKKFSVNYFSMIKGYRIMAKINSEKSEEAAHACSEALSTCENSFTESEGIDSKKRRHILRRS